ncbi:MAG: endonuclease domain-containing protein [Dongiaceae bacterium]
MPSQLARHLRRSLTAAEQRLWTKLRRCQVEDCRFRRQVPIGSFVIDFACLERKLLIEVDGGLHAGRELYDAQRTRWLESRGYRVLRFPNSQVMWDIEAVLQTIRSALVA